VPEPLSGSAGHRFVVFVGHERIAEIAGRRGNEMLMMVCVGADDMERKKDEPHSR
jgi:hypothetical protein